MEINSTGYILQARPHGERSFILRIFTPEHGVIAGLYRGSRKQQALLQPLAEVQVTHRRRLADQLGSLSMELVKDHSSRWLNDAVRLAVIQYLAEILVPTLPEEQPYPELHEALTELLNQLGDKQLVAKLVRWEVLLLEELGVGLSLDPSQAVREGAGDTSELRYVSPRSGRVVSARKGQEYADKLLPLPTCLGGPESVPDQQGLALTERFLAQVMELKKLPARQRLLSMFN